MKTPEDIQRLSLAEIANDTKHIPVLNKFGLDYCCGGHQTLTQACAKQGLPADVVALEILTADESSPKTESPDFIGMPMDELATYIVEKHHKYIETQTPEILRLTEKIAQVHGARNPELLPIRDAFAEITGELAQHMKKEELVLFPYIKHLASVLAGKAELRTPGFGTVGNPVRMMQAEHEDAGTIMAKIRSLSNNYTLPEGACASYWQTFHMLKEYEADLHMHIHLENNILFPAALKAEDNLKTITRS